MREGEEGGCLTFIIIFRTGYFKFSLKQMELIEVELSFCYDMRERRKEGGRKERTHKVVYVYILMYCPLWASH